MIIQVLHMIFKVLPVIDIMLSLYEKPRTAERFQEYLKTLQGDTKGDLIVPIGGFNPMAKEHAVSKLQELKSLNAEEIMSETLAQVNQKTSLHKAVDFKVALNLADDLKGGWTNHFTTDFDSKFKTDALVRRNFCVPVFWTSEDFDQQKIIQRTKEYCYRTVYRLEHGKPTTLENHIEQEKYVAKSIGNKKGFDMDLSTLNNFYEKNKAGNDWITIFNFFYGDAAVASLGNKPMGIEEDHAGFKYAACLAVH